PPGEVDGPAQRATRDQDQSPMAVVFHLAGRRCLCCRDRGLALRCAMGIRIEDIDTIDLSEVVNADAPPVPVAHPDEYLAEILAELGLSQYRVARSMSVPPRRINEIVQGKRAITADTALRLARVFGMSADFWIGLQA